jgi:ribosomal protein S13
MTEDLTLQIQKLEEENKKLKKRAEEAEGENTIIKGIGNNSPEMRALQAKVKEAEKINKLHQELNGSLQKRLTEVEEDNKKLSQQISDYIKKYEDTIRKSGL